MPNLTPESPLYQAVKLLIGLLPPDERGRLRFWVAAKFDVRGDMAIGFVDRGAPDPGE
jgi:hypothetical protein